MKHGQRVRIVAEEDLKEGATHKFTFEKEGIRREGFVLRHEGKVVAYENLCMHLPLSLNYGDNQFFTRDKRHLVCQTHYALYEPATGLCVQGPCEGAKLRRLEISLSEGTIWLDPVR